MPADREPDPFHDVFVAPIAARAVIAGVATGLFESLADEAADPAAVAERLGLDPAGVEALAAALTALGYLEAEGGRVRPSAAAARLLVRDSPESIATFAGGLGRHHWDAMGGLDEALRGGEPAGWHRRGPDDPLWEPYVRGLYELSRGEHDANAALVPGEPRELLDVAGGHGAFAMAMCRRHPGLRATVLELPGSARVGREIVAGEGMADRVSFREGDVFEDDLGEGLDAVSAFNLIHHLPPERVLELFRRARGALGPGGCLVVGDTDRPPLDSDLRVGALTGLAFYAESGARTYSLAEVEGWLREAGFDRVDAHRNEVSPWRIVVVARLPSAP
ncbi:MAG TPA: class I SAM-dependent methyltransferase [Thermoleophilaceae bacterium]